MLKSSSLSPQLSFEVELTEQDLLESLMCVSAMLLLQFLSSNDGIELARGGSFNRGFVEWAVATFKWPGYALKDILAKDGDIVERHFLPLYNMHSVLVNAHLVRHSRNRAIITKNGAKFLGKHGELQAVLADTMLRHPVGKVSTPKHDAEIAHILGVMRHNLVGWASISECADLAMNLRQTPIREGMDAHYLNYVVLIFNMVRPLNWLGLLYHDSAEPGLDKIEDYRICKTSLFDRFVHITVPEGQ